eukprot:244132-Chlamydomonas_euryale.AAC.17
MLSSSHCSSTFPARSEFGWREVQAEVSAQQHRLWPNQAQRVMRKALARHPVCMFRNDVTSWRMCPTLQGPHLVNVGPTSAT